MPRCSDAFLFFQVDVVERDRGQDGHFGVRPHQSELKNGANLTDYGRNRFGVKKIWISGLDVQPNFSVACVSNASFLIAGCLHSVANRGPSAAARCASRPTLDEGLICGFKY
jgi:hypothetical protein